MNEQIRWEQSLVKKYSSSNHFKMINQLRNEVKKYPLNNRKNIIRKISNDYNHDKANNQSLSNLNEPSLHQASNQIKDKSTNESSVSFNNSKNFSIYNQTTSTNNFRQSESSFHDQLKPNNDSSSPTFKERLNQIDMK